MSEMNTIQRCPHDKENPYAQINRDLIRDKSISPECRWLLIYLLSMKDGWKLKITQIHEHVREFIGINKVYRLIRECIEAGYIKKIITHKGNLRQNISYIVSESPKFKEFFRSDDFGDVEPRHVENSDYKKELSLKEEHLEEKKEYKKERKGSKPPPSAPPITLNSDTKKFEGITDEDIKRWQDTFPAVNVRKEIQEALLWALNAPRSNYRKSLNTWMSNVNKSHTTPYKEKIKASEPASLEDVDKNKKQAEKWESEFSKRGIQNYSVQSAPNKVNFILPDNQGYSVEYSISSEEFLRLCQKAAKKMKLE